MEDKNYSRERVPETSEDLVVIFANASEQLHAASLASGCSPGDEPGNPMFTEFVLCTRAAAAPYLQVQTGYAGMLLRESLMSTLTSGISVASSIRNLEPGECIEAYRWSDDGPFRRPVWRRMAADDPKCDTGRATSAALFLGQQFAPRDYSTTGVSESGFVFGKAATATLARIFVKECNASLRCLSSAMENTTIEEVFFEQRIRSPMRVTDISIAEVMTGWHTDLVAGDPTVSLVTLFNNPGDCLYVGVGNTGDELPSFVRVRTSTFGFPDCPDVDADMLAESISLDF